MASFHVCHCEFGMEMIVRKWFKPFEIIIMQIFLIQCQYTIID